MKYVTKEKPTVKVTAEKVKADTTIKTIYGDVLVEKDNYILTDEDGNRVGITQADLDRQYKKSNWKRTE